MGMKAHGVLKGVARLPPCMMASRAALTCWARCRLRCRRSTVRSPSKMRMPLCSKAPRLLAKVMVPARRKRVPISGIRSNEPVDDQPARRPKVEGHAGHAQQDGRHHGVRKVGLYGMGDVQEQPRHRRELPPDRA